jgi:site-specific DNA-methyltransferase (adenine-specific)
MNKLYFGDNLEIMREMEDGHVDLICTDPPFNSGRDYNTFLGDSLAQKKAFTDIWTWDTAAKNARADIENRALECDVYKALDECLQGYDLMLGRSVSGNKGAMRAYLAFMGQRLVEMHRLLAKKGSIFLHCDPTASHYLKCMMDAIFGDENFRNEIVWGYKGPSNVKRWFPRKHDIILFYGKSKSSYFNPDGARVAYTRISGTGRSSLTRGNRTSDEVIALEEAYSERGKLVEDYWVDIPGSGHMPRDERLDYPTQKPRTLYERMINVASKEGNLVMDPFCGCGTTIDAAESLGRRWIGIDLTILALDPMGHRLEDRHGLKPSINYEIEGYPTNMQEVRKLLKDGDKRKRHDFSNWAVTRLGLTPTKDVGDGGHDGVGNFKVWTPEGVERTEARILAEVKTGKPTIEQVRAFRTSMQDNEAEIGVFITIESVSSGILQQAEAMGTFKHNNRNYPRLQFWQIDDDYFKNPEIINKIIRLPSEWMIRPTKKSERHFLNKQLQLDFK